MNLNIKQWLGIEGKAGKAAKVKSEAKKRAGKIVVPPLVGDKTPEIPGRMNGIEGYLNENTPVKEKVEEIIYQNQYEELMGKSLTEISRINVEEAKWMYLAFENKQRQLNEIYEKSVADIAFNNGKPDLNKTDKAREIKNLLELLEKQKLEFENSNPDARYVFKLLELRSYDRSLRSGNLAELPYVKEKIKEIETNLLSGNPVFIHGHLGTGKTELAFHVARKLLKGRKDLVERNSNDEITKDNRSPLIISGSKQTTIADLFGHNVLDVSDAGVNKVSEKECRDEFDKLVIDNADELAMKMFYSKWFAQNQATISRFDLGPIYKAAEEGRPVIIDEVNAIPHEVLIALNFILTQKAGTDIKIQQNGRTIKIKEGFGIILTGNLGGQYTQRQEMDIAFMRRVDPIEYGYLPEEQQKILLTIRLCDRSPHGYFPEDTFKKIEQLAHVAVRAQNNFIGKNTETTNFGGAQNKAFRLTKSTLDQGRLFRIIDAWKGGTYEYEFDYYLYTTFLSKTESSAEKAFYYLLFSSAGFFNSYGWPVKNADVFSDISGHITWKLESIPKNKTGDLVFFDGRDVVDNLFGAGPERSAEDYKAAEILANKNSGTIQQQVQVPTSPSTEDIILQEHARTVENRKLDERIAETMARSLAADAAIAAVTVAAVKK